MNYLLIGRIWIDIVRRELWFPLEAVPYPVDDETPEFLKGAYFIPEFRIQQHPKTVHLLLGAYESHAFARLQLCNDYSKELGQSVITL